MFNLAKNTEDPSVIISDRGLMDTAGYVGFDVFHQILDQTGWDIADLRDNRYDAIIHLVTAADGAAEFYDHENPARYENVEEAVERDLELRKAYVGHNKVFFVNNNQPDGFAGKMNKTLAHVNTLLGLPTEKTRYKKFLLGSMDVDELDQDNLLEHQHKIFCANDIKPFNHAKDQDK